MVEVKKLQGKKINITSAKLYGKQAVNPVPKWKTKIAALLGIPICEQYSYVYQITYKGNFTLQISDVLTNSNGIFRVVNIMGRMAIIASYTTFKEAPVLKGSMNVEGRKISKPENKKDKNSK